MKQWIGPYKVLKINNNSITTNYGKFSTKLKLNVGYTYRFLVDNNTIIDYGMMCVDLIVLIDNKDSYRLLTIKRKNEPYQGYNALPGGIIDERETILDAALRELKEETSLVSDNAFYVGYFDKPYRDPRNKNCISYAYCIILNEMPIVKAGDDATDYEWVKVSYDGEVSDVEMAFDHIDMIKKAIDIKLNDNY